jgi:hypothetical protein
VFTCGEHDDEEVEEIWKGLGVLRSIASLCYYRCNPFEESSKEKEGKGDAVCCLKMRL